MDISTLKKYEDVFNNQGFEIYKQIGGRIYMFDDGGIDDVMPEVPYIAYFDAGAGYDSNLEVCDGEETLGCRYVAEGVPVVPVNEDGKVDKLELSNVRKVIKMRKKVGTILVEAEKE